MASKKPEIVAAISRRYPCGGVPFGALTELGVEFGVTREYVRQICAQMRVTTALPKPHMVRVCARCGSPISKQGREFCRLCSKVDLPCERCGAMVRRSVANLVWRNGRTTKMKATYQGRVFCGRRCFNEWFASAASGGGRPENVRLRDALMAAATDGIVPRGTYQKIARDLGLGHTTVSAKAAQLGITTGRRTA